MSSEIYQFNLGAFQCIAISDGINTYAPPTFPPPTTLLFSNAPGNQLGEALHEHDIQPQQWTEWVSPYICLLVNTGDQRVLVDTGANGLSPNTGKLIQNLRAVGIPPASINIVILTHCHPDHISGNTLDTGQLAFPNAHFTMWKDEWEFWTSEEVEARLDEHIREMLLRATRKNLPPVQDRLELIESEEAIVPGIQAIAAPGHTLGRMALLISSDGEQLLHIADAALHPIHLERPEWCTAFDFDPEQTIDTRRRLFTWVVSEQALVLAFHFPFPGLGHVVPKEEAWEWQPI